MFCPPGTTDELIYDSIVGVGAQELAAALDAATVHGELRRADSPHTAGDIARERLTSWRRSTGKSLDVKPWKAHLRGREVTKGERKDQEARAAEHHRRREQTIARSRQGSAAQGAKQEHAEWLQAQERDAATRVQREKRKLAAALAGAPNFTAAQEAWAKLQVANGAAAQSRALMGRGPPGRKRAAGKAPPRCGGQ